MAEQNPTVIIAHLNDEKLRKSIDSLVGYVDEKFKAMTTNTTNAVNTMQQELQKLGSLNAKGVGGAGGGELGITKALQRAKQEAKESSVTFDQMAASMQKATTGNGNKTIFSTMGTEIAILKERLVEAKSQVESFTVMARRGAETGDKGLFVFSTENLHKYEAEVATLTQQINSLTSQRQALKEMLNPQGDAFKNYVDSLTKANPELAALNAQYKEGKSLLQQQTSEVKRKNQEEQEGIRSAKEIAAAQERYSQQLREASSQEKSSQKERAAAAMETAKALREAMKAQKDDNIANNTQKSIAGVRELHDVINQMHRTYLKMSEEEKASPIGKSLQQDILLSRQALQEYEKYNRALLGMASRDPIANRDKVDSYTMLSNRVRQLTKEYQAMATAERDSSKGKGVAEKIQLFSRALSEIQKQMNRPISLSKAMGLDENTLDRIAYKIQQLNAYRGGLNITDPKQVGEMRTVENEIDRLKKKQDELMGKNHQLMNSNNALARSWNYMKNRLAFYFTVGASTQFVKNLIEVRSQYEMNERALGILIDSAERGTQIFNELSQMALVSPYTLIELSTAAKQLSAYDVAAKDVVDTTRRLADISAAVGVPVERFTYALGQVKAFGHLTSQDARQFLNTGVPLVKELAKHYTELEGRLVSTADVYERMKKHAVSYNDVVTVLNKMTDEGGKFFDFQAKMADTLKVQLANLTLAWNNMLNEIGKSEQGVLVGGIKGLKELFLQWENINKLVRNLAITFGVAKLAQVIQIATLGMDAFGKKMVWQILVGKKLQVVLYNIAGTLKSIVSSPLTWWALLATAVTSVAMAFYDADKAIKGLNKSIIDGANERVESINKILANLNSKYNFEEFAPSEHMLSSDVSKDEAKKIWETIREEIEMSSSSAQEFINRLEDIDDVNVRVGKGFDYLKDIQKAQAALSQLDIKDIDVEQDMAGWYNLYALQDGLIENFRDMQKEAGRAEKDWKDYAIRAVQGFHWGGGLGAIIGGIGIKGNEGEHLKRYQEDLQTTVDSIISSMKKYNVEGANVQREFFATSMDKILQDTDLTEKERLKIRIDAQELFYQSEVKSRQQAIAKETGDYKNALQQELNDFIHFHEQRNGYTLGFEQWLQKTQITMLTDTFGKMSAEELKRIDFSKGEWSKWAYEISKKFAEQNNLAIDDVFANLRKYLSKDFTLYIKTVLQKPDDKSVYDTLTEADKAADEAWNKIQRLKTHKGELESKGAIVAGTRDIDTDYANTIQEITDAQKDYNDALAKGGHSKKENTSDTKSQKQAETELQKALKDELSLLDKLRSQYKKLTDAGVDGTTALNMVTNQFTNSIQRINNILGRNGLPLFNIKAFAGIDNPNAVLKMLKKQLDAAKVAKNIKPEEIKELEVKYGEIVIDAKVYNTKKITDGLNNELSKIKDEYELAVELDANPEMGSAFAQLFDIDTNQLPKNLEDYAKRATEILNRYFKDDKIELPTINLTDDDLKAYKAILGESKYKILESFTKDYKSRSKKEAQDIVKQTKDLQYKLGDVNEKIAIESKKLADLQVKYQKETNDEKKRLLDLQIKDQENAIAKLGEEVLQMLPTYKNLFNSIAEHSAVVTRRIAEQWKNALENAVKNPDGTYTITDPQSGEKATLSEKEYGKQLDKVNGKLRETQSSFAKIKEAFTKGKDGEIDSAKGLEYIAEEAKKAADGLRTVADIFSSLGRSDTAEKLNDIATSMDGVAKAAQGVIQIKNKDYIGGASNVITGAWQAISTWFDNSDNNISRQIEASERQVRKLELAYIDLEHAIDNAYGMATIGAQKAAIANKELQLAELKRQLTLEQSRKKKNQDKDRIIELQKQIKELEYDIKSMTDEIVNDLLGISSVGDAMESLMDSFIEALRSGEDAMAVFDDSIDNMIANMVKKMFTTKILQPWFEQQWDLIQKDIDERVGKEMPKKIAELTGQVDTAKRANLTNRDSVWEALASMGLSAEQIHQYESYDAAGNYIFDASKRFERRKELYEKMLDDKEKELDAAQREYTELTTPTVDDIKKWAVLLRSGDITVEQWQGYLDGLLTDLDLMKDSKDKTLSNLQQGIRGVTEETAGAIESYLNGMSQQVYYQSDILTQIRDTVQGFDLDVQLGVQSQMLLQLQNSYQTQNAIRSIMEGWSSPNGMSVRVEMI